ncbi:hypothetical protein [Tessaracoccus caeni]|uniref:hypothetical protein n=1 Tax=Tessaracoccus caeni TaxID=3031239 RepID=UPI0023DB924B|nr:hypothetical protein [Tessaracoccus caeni]MDF1488469.1 hypothetical protein [Tessaracoccus caeni]
MDHWQPVPLEATVGSLVGENLAVSGTGPDGKRTLVLVKVTARKDGAVWVWVSDTATRTPMPVATRASTGATVTLRAAILAHADVEAHSAARVPYETRWPSDITRPGGNPWLFLATAALIVTMVVFFAVGLPSVGMAFFVPAVLTAIAARPRGNSTVNGVASVFSPTDGGGGSLFAASMMSSAVLAQIPPPEAAVGVSPVERVGVVKASYGEKLADIVYRIENSALFDAAVPETQRFQVALVGWEESSPDAERLATELERAYDEAMRNAERLGVSHLPETARDPARRAAKAATIALGDGPEAERDAARARVAEILNSLALYYLPSVDPTAPALIGQRRAIEPGR